MGKGKKSNKGQEVKPAVQEKAEEKPPVDTEMEHVKNTIEFHTRSLDRLKTIRTGKRKILDIFRQSGEQLDKKLMEQLHERYNEFVCQESEILELLRRTMGLNQTEDGNPSEADTAVNDLCAQIAETNAKLAQAKQKNDKLEREATNRKTNVKEIEEQRDSLQNRVRKIQEENVSKKQTVLKYLSILRENPEILDKNLKAGNPEPGFSCIQAAQSTPGTSKEYDEISKHLESIKARRGRMNAIRERLSQVSAAQTMDDTYQSALKRLDALSTIRKTLEETTTTATGVEEEATTESNLKEENTPEGKIPLETKPPLTSTTSVQLVTDSDGDEDEEEEDEEEVNKNAESKREESKEPIDDETKRAAAISEINSARGKLQKQRTLERVRIFATSGTTSFDKTVEEPDSNGVEKEICLIIEDVVPWLNKHENDKVTAKFVTELRELIIGMANKICFPAGVNSDLFKTQLTTILDDAILQVADDTFKKSHNAIVSEVSEILYNELTFFKLINDIDSMGVEED